MHHADRLLPPSRARSQSEPAQSRRHRGVGTKFEEKERRLVALPPRQASAGRQQAYMAMRVATAATDAPTTKVRGGIRYLVTQGSGTVPGEVWEWMRGQIRDTDKVGQAWADRILTGGDEKGEGAQVYTIALRGQAEGSGRGCRLTELRNYKETRDRQRNGDAREPTQCRLTVQMKVVHGWRLQRAIAGMRVQGSNGDRADDGPTGRPRGTTEDRTGRATRGARGEEAGEADGRDRANEREAERIEAGTAGQGRGGGGGGSGGGGRESDGVARREGRRR